MLLNLEVTQPEWFLSVPIFQPVDPTFSMLDYFVWQGDIQNYYLREQDCLDFEFTTKKFVADFVENPDIEFISKYRDFFVYWDNDRQTILTCYEEEGWESAPINLCNLDYVARSLGDNILAFAQQFIDSLILAKMFSQGQLKLQLA